MEVPSMLLMNLWCTNTNGNFVWLGCKQEAADLSLGEVVILTLLGGQDSGFRSLLHGVFAHFAFRVTK